LPSETLPQPTSASRLHEVREWLAKRAEAKQAAIPTPRPVDPSTPMSVPVHATPAKSSYSPAGSRHSGALAGSGPLSPNPDRPSQYALDQRKKFPEVGDQLGKYFLAEEVAG